MSGINLLRLSVTTIVTFLNITHGDGILKSKVLLSNKTSVCPDVNFGYRQNTGTRLTDRKDLQTKKKIVLLYYSLGQRFQKESKLDHIGEKAIFIFRSRRRDEPQTRKKEIYILYGNLQKSWRGGELSGTLSLLPHRTLSTSVVSPIISM